LRVKKKKMLRGKGQRMPKESKPSWVKVKAKMGCCKTFLSGWAAGWNGNILGIKRANEEEKSGVGGGGRSLFEGELLYILTSHGKERLAGYSGTSQYPRGGSPDGA